MVTPLRIATVWEGWFAPQQVVEHRGVQNIWLEGMGRSCHMDHCLWVHRYLQETVLYFASGMGVFLGAVGQKQRCLK